MIQQKVRQMQTSYYFRGTTNQQQHGKLQNGCSLPLSKSPISLLWPTLIGNIQGREFWEMYFILDKLTP
jgi:hypothetical protein